MRIGIYKDTLANRRGADIAVLALADGLAERGHEVAVFEKPELAQRLNEKWDVLISAGTNELADLDGVAFPVIQQFHTNPESVFKWKRVARNRKIRAALRRVAAIQVLRKAHLPTVEGFGPPAVAIGNWSAYGQNACAHASSSAESKTILCPAAFSKSKNHKLLLKAFSLLKDEFPDWSLELYGNGRPPANLPANVKAMGFANLREAYEKCAFLAFPSADEGFGLVIAEAASFGKPAVMIRDWIGTAEAAGAIITSPTTESYANGLRRLMQDPDLRIRTGENAQWFCEAEYSRKKIIDQWEILLSQTVNTRNLSTRLGIGIRRSCHRLSDTTLCLKGYRTQEEITLGMSPDDTSTQPLKSTVVEEIRSARFDTSRNTCSQEWQYWHRLKSRLPADLMAIFPAQMYRILVPERGWCCVEELVENSDGTSAQSFSEAWQSADTAARNLLWHALNKLETDMIRHAVHIYDPQNILVQRLANGSFRLRITDFEPGARTLIPVDSLSPVLVRLKVRRRFARYRNNNAIPPC